MKQNGRTVPAGVMSVQERRQRCVLLRGLQKRAQAILDRAREKQRAPAQLPGPPHSGVLDVGRCSGAKRDRGEEDDEALREG